ncbi:hypothetical protein [Burkholderia humptydooensis]|uniref:hypothetical protein n=1 Tax=Burkholderia humptydooensis TaxID=430531 RepID=UPI001E6239DC|nr:hypothetical protein [Burkholderia humptydooensis]
MVALAQIGIFDDGARVRQPRIPICIGQALEDRRDRPAIRARTIDAHVDDATRRVIAQRDAERRVVGRQARRQRRRRLMRADHLYRACAVRKRTDDSAKNFVPPRHGVGGVEEAMRIQSAVQRQGDDVGAPGAVARPLRLLLWRKAVSRRRVSQVDLHDVIRLFFP